MPKWQTLVCTLASSRQKLKVRPQNLDLPQPTAGSTDYFLVDADILGPANRKAILKVTLLAGLVIKIHRRILPPRPLMVAGLPVLVPWVLLIQVRKSLPRLSRSRVKQQLVPLTYMVRPLARVAFPLDK